MNILLEWGQGAVDRLLALRELWPWLEHYTAVVRFIFPVLAILILAGAIRSLITVPHAPEYWAMLSLPNGVHVPLGHWENIIGRSPSSDVVVNYPTVSRQHAALIRREDESWTLYDLESKGGTVLNGAPVNGSAQVKAGDTLELGGVPLMLVPVNPEEQRRQEKARDARPPRSPWGALVVMTVFQVLTAVQLIFSAGSEASPMVPLSFLALTGVMWVYFIAMRLAGRVGFEMETIAFFLSTLSLAITGSSSASSLPKQLLALLMGLALFVVMGLFLRDLQRVQQLRWVMAAAAIGLLGVTLVVGPRIFGATNWIILGPLSFQPSELAKICYIFAGAATLERLFRKRNLWLFIVLTGACLGCLALMSDYGTAAIFFVTFLVIAYLRSGDFATLALICAGAVFGVFIVLQLKPYILARFSTWLHAWEYASSGGYQQVRTMSAAASGGLVGLGAGNGWLRWVGAADTDLVFGMLCEEWGLVIALLSALSIVTLAVFAVRSCRAGRSAFYTIAACAATSLLVFQTCLNVFGSVDLLPLTGVTFPFVSNGGSAMLAAWGLLAFLKATDTRPNASFAIRRPQKRGGEREEGSRA